jgi:hypothetical protein
MCNMSSYLWIPVIQMLGYGDLLTLRCLNNSFRQRVYDYGQINLNVLLHCYYYNISSDSTEIKEQYICSVDIHNNIGGVGPELDKHFSDNYCNYIHNIKSIQKICRHMKEEIFTCYHPILYQPSGTSPISRVDGSHNVSKLIINSGSKCDHNLKFKEIKYHK